MAASLFRINYINGNPDLDGDPLSWSFWSEENVDGPNAQQVLMHVENERSVLEAMKLQPERYTWVEDLWGWEE